MKNKTKQVAPKCYIIELTQWNDPKNPPKGVSVLESSLDEVRGEYRFECGFKICDLGDWIGANHLGRITHFNDTEFRERYVEIKQND